VIVVGGWFLGQFQITPSRCGQLYSIRPLVFRVVEGILMQYFLHELERKFQKINKRRHSVKKLNTRSDQH
jgi:hypothetical protein